MIDKEAIFKIFEKVLSNKEAARMALKNPGKVLSQYGLAISDEDMFNSIFFDISPKMRAQQFPRKLVLPTSSGTEKQGAAKIEMNKQSNHSGANHE